MTIPLGGVCNAMLPSVYCAVWDEEKTTQYSIRFNWSYQRRGPSAQTDQMRQYANSYDLWTPARFLSGGGAVIGQDGGTYVTPFEPFSYGDGGQMGQLFIRGQCLDVNDSPVSGVTVESYLLVIGAPDLNAGATVSDANGYFAAPTPYPGVSHYCVGYKSGSPSLAGNTLNTLIPTN